MIFNYEIFVEEMSMAPLYHAIEFKKGEKAIRSNKLDCYSFQRIWDEGKRLKDDDPEYYKSKYLRGISLSRDIEYAKGWNNIVFEFDQSKLKTKWKIIPYNWGYSIGGGYRQKERAKREREEFLITGITKEIDIEKPFGSIQPLDKYLTGFWIDSFIKGLNGYDTRYLENHELFKGFFNRRKN